MTTEKIENIRKTIEDYKTQLAIAQNKKEEILDEMERLYQIKSVDDAESNIKKVSKEIDALEDDLNNLINNIETLLNKIDENESDGN